MMVAVVVLLAVIIATSKIFSTASKVTSTGEATADVLQQAGVIEEQIRRDLNNITQNGYMAIQCVAVRNDVNRTWIATAPLINPELAPDAVIRADTVVFFTAGKETTMRWSGPNDTSAYGGNQESRAARVYYGHGVQLPTLGNNPEDATPSTGAGSPSRIKPIIQGITGAGGMPNQILPWTWANPATASVRWQWGTTNNNSGGAPKVSPNQPGAREWVLCRKSTLLADDGGRVLYYPDPPIGSLGNAVGLGPSSAPSVFGDAANTGSLGFSGNDTASGYLEMRARAYVPTSNSGASRLVPSPMMQSGWVDIAASELDDIRRCIAPTLTLTTAYGIPSTGTAQVFLNSIATPWVCQPGALTPFDKPLGWPSTEPWPNVPVTGPHLASPASTGGFTSQRDRIIRGTFGPVNSASQFSSANFSNLGLAAWPRAEKVLPNSDRGSEILAGGVLSNNCSSFQVDWTWDRGTGKQEDDTGAPLTAFYQLGNMVNAATMRGYEPDAGPWNVAAGDFTRQPRPQPWFGFPDTGWGSGNGAVIPLAAQRMGVTLAQDPAAMPIYLSPPPPALPANSTNVHMQRVAQGIEGIPGHALVPAVQHPWGAGVPIVVYTAIFGFNQDQAYLVTPDGLPVMRDDFTPWPSQLRFTLTLHDPRLVLDRGREFQFVVDVPKRKK